MRLSRYIQKDLENIPSRLLYTTFGSEPEDVVELHLYSGEKNLIQSDHEVEGWTVNSYNPTDKTNKEPHIELNVHEDVRQFGFASGRYNVKYNFFRNILSHAEHLDGLHITEIGSSRTEIRVNTTSKDTDFLADIRSFKFDRRPNSYGCFEDFLINFGNNVLAHVVNWRKDVEGGIMFKLYEPLPKEIEVKDKIWLVKELITPIQYRVKLVPLDKPGEGQYIPGPNFELEIAKTITPSSFETWDDVLGLNKQNKTNLINKFTSGSYSQTALNIDYHSYDAFVHFSNAQERLENFKYKMKLIEAYSSSLATISAIPFYSQSKITQANQVEWESKIEAIKNGFDGYESYLYFQSSSYSSASDGTVLWPRTWPKTNSKKPYENAKVDSAAATAWFASQSNVAIDYDVVKNEHNLLQSIPFHIREDFDNKNYLTFVNMVGHHFDELWTYISHSRDINSRENPLYEGISKDIVYNVLASFGWESFQGFHFNDLWEYSLGTDAEANYAMEHNNISAQLRLINHSNATKTDGYAEVIHHTGTPPYTYEWDTTQAALTGFSGQLDGQMIGPLQNDGTIEVTVRDSNNREVTLSDSLTVNPTTPIDLGSVTTGYVYATNANVTGSTQIVLASQQLKSGSMTREELSRETWKRMLNNIPHLLKTKGSERGIKALITTYGLPPTLLRVFEYGGPRKDRKTGSFIRYDKFSYSLEFTGSQHIDIPWRQINQAGVVGNHPFSQSGQAPRAPDSFELRFNTWTKTSQSLVSLGTGPHLGIVPHISSSNPNSKYYNFGAVTYYYDGQIKSSSFLPLYDNDWWNVMISRETASATVCKAADHSRGRITHTSSVRIIGKEGASTARWNANNTFKLGSNAANTSYAKFSGSIQEVRFWMMPYADQVALDHWNELGPFWNHVRDPQQIEGYGATGSYNQLLGRWSLGADLNRYSQSWGPASNSAAFITSSAPSNKKRPDPYIAGDNSHIVATINGWEMDLTIDWPSEEERYFTQMPDLVGTRELSDKTRIEESTLLGRLTNDRKVERSTYDKSPLDSNRLGVFFAPTFEIDLDIAREIGGAQFDNYIGNPLDLRHNEYRRLRMLRQHYWYKHENPYDFYDYIKILRHLDHTLFKQIEMIVPARCNAQIGLLVKPNMLERPKAKHMFEIRDYKDVWGRVRIEPARIMAATTELGGRVHQWQDPKTGKWSTGSAQAGTYARNAFTQFRTYYSNSFNDHPLYTEQSEGALVLFLDSTTHH